MDSLDLIPPAHDVPVRELFGGAMQMQLEARFVDASQFRQIPDNQEVFLDSSTDESVIVELVEPFKGGSDADAARHYLSGLAEDNSAEGPAEIVAEGDRAGLAPAEPAPFPVRFVVADMRVSKFREAARNLVRVYLLVMRLERVETDLLVTYNVPVRVDVHSSVADRPPVSVEAHRQVFGSVVGSIRVNDWRLFTG